MRATSRPRRASACVPSRCRRRRRSAPRSWAGQIAAVEARIAELDLAALAERQGAAEERKAASALERKRVEGQLESLLRRARPRRGRARRRRRPARGGDRQLSTACGAPASAWLCEPRASTIWPSGYGASSRRRARPGPRTMSEQTLAAAREAARERERLTAQAAAAADRLRALERSLAEREGIPPAARELSERGHALALDGLEVDPGYERAVAAALAFRASAVTAADCVGGARAGRGRPQPRAGPAVRPRPGDRSGRPRRGADAERRASGRPRPRRRTCPRTRGSSSREELLQARRGVVVTKEGTASRPSVASCGSQARPPRASCSSSKAGGSGWSRRSPSWSAAATACRGARGRSGAARRGVARGRATRVGGGSGAARRRRWRERRPLLAAAREASERLETPLRARADAGGTRTGELAAELRQLGASEADLRREAGEARERAGSIDVELATIAAERREATRRLEGAARRSRRRRGQRGARGSRWRSSAGAARRSARSIRSHRRSTSARRSASRSWSSSARTSRRASSSSSSCAPS